MTSVNQVLGLGYERISDDDSGEAAGVNRQRRRNDQLAEEHGVPLVAHFCDNHRSASKNLGKRDQYREMLARIEKGDIRRVFAWSADRLHRSTKEAEEFIELGRRHKIIVITETGMIYNLVKSDGRRAFMKDAADAQWESEHRGERVAEAREDQALQGRYGGGSARPYGWGLFTHEPQYREDKKRGQVLKEPVRVDADGRAVWLDMTQHNPHEAKEIKRMARQVLDRVPMAQIIRDLKKRQVPTQTEADSRVINKGGKAAKHAGWNSRSIGQILTHPRVAGHTTYRGEIVKRNAWPAILTEDERQACIAEFQRRTREGKTTPGNAPKWLVSMTAECGICNDGAVMSVRSRNDGLAVYRCRKVGHGSRDALAVDEYVTLVLLEMIKREGVDIARRDPSADIDVDGLRAEKDRLKLRLKNQRHMNLDGLLDDDDLAESAAYVKSRTAEIDAELEKAHQSDSLLVQMALADDGLQFWDACTIGQRREMVREALRIVILPGKTRDVNEGTVQITSRALDN